jgi:hypothetical protein
MNQGPRYVRLMEKSRGQKSSATAPLISLRSEAKNSKRKEAKKNIYFSRERAKRMRNGSRFASFRFEAKNFFLRNRRTLIPSILIQKLT